MEQFRKEAKKLAILNVVLQTLFIAISVFAVALFLSNPVNLRVKGFTFFLSITGVPLFGVLFCLWLQFLDELKSKYEGNETILSAVRMGRAAIALKIAYTLIGSFGALILANQSGIMQGSINASDFGLVPSNGAGTICKGLMFAIAPFTSFMYLLFAEVSERKSEMRFITLILALLSIVYLVSSACTDSIYTTILQPVFYIGESLFLWKIYKGDTFTDDKKE